QNTGKPERDPTLVYWQMIVGVPWQDLANDQSDLTKGYMSTSDITGKGVWSQILGDPATNTPPADPLMIESIDPRKGTNRATATLLIDPASAKTSRDNPINGHEWDISGRRDDLQYACIFPLPAPKDCSTSAANCDCGDGF